MEDNDITMEKYVQRETERALRNDFLPEPTVSPQHVDEVNLKSERLLFEYDDKNNDNDKINTEQSLRDLSIEPLPNVIKINTQGLNKLLET
nr:hypothetical protein [Tanacetum cinerariifolium]